MLLSLLRHEPFLGTKARLSSPTAHELSSDASAVSKTTQHNAFLSLFTSTQTRRAPLVNMPAMSITSTVEVTTERLAAETTQVTERLVQFGSKPKREKTDHKTANIRPSMPEIRSDVPLPNPERDRVVKALDPKVIDIDADIDALIKGLNDHVMIKDMAVSEAKTLDLPRGYPMDSEVTPSDFYRERAGIRSHIKRKRQDVIMPKFSKRELRNIGGFRPQDVNLAGAVSLWGCRASNLDNEIHPLLVRSRFDDTPDAIYDQLVPALRLATMFLTQPVCMQFWVTVALGERHCDPEMSSKYGRKCQRIPNHVELTKENTAKVIRHLRELGDANIIHFAFRHKLLQEVGGAWGSSGPICDYLGARRTCGLKGRLTRSIIRLHADHYIIAKKLSQLKYPEVSQELRFSFFFANLIMHELAHSIEGAYIKMRHEQWVEYQRSKTYVEPFWMDWQRPPECGKAWEQTMFGGEIQPINNRVDGSHGVGTSDWPPHGSDLDPEKRTWYSIPMTYIENLFQKNTWQRPYELDDWMAFHIPRLGATSLYVNCFTTMSLSEDRRVANEDIRELITNITEQPPPKMRLTSTGTKEEHRLNEGEAIEQAIAEHQQKEEYSKEVPKLPSTRRLSSVCSGPLLSSRDDAKEDKPDGLTAQQMYRLVEQIAASKTALKVLYTKVKEQVSIVPARTIKKHANQKRAR